MSASHCTTAGTTHRPMLKFAGVSSSVESGFKSNQVLFSHTYNLQYVHFICHPHQSSLSNSLMRNGLNLPSDVTPSISFWENIVHYFDMF